MAVKRNIGHAGQDALARIADTQVGRWAVTRSEHLLACYFLGAAQRWFREMYFALGVRLAALEA